MDVHEAVTSRRAVRGFRNTYVLTGAPLAELKTRAVERVAHGDPWDERQYEVPVRGAPIRLRQGALQRASASAR